MYTSKNLQSLAEHSGGASLQHPLEHVHAER